MSDDDQDDASKTEDPSQKRLDDAFKKGQVVTSREVNSFFLLLSLTAIIIWLSPGIMHDLMLRLARYVTMPDDIDVDKASFGNEMGSLMSDVMGIMLLPSVVVIASIFAANIVQNRFVFSADPIAPKLSKISPLKGLKKLFSRKSLVEFLKGIFKITVVGAVAIMSIMPYKNHLTILPDEDIYELLAFISTITGHMMIGICIIMFLIALFDFTYQKFEFNRNLRMTKQELKDEYKQQEGDPLVKQKLRQIRRERAQKRMMENVPKADVIITNPSHYAVALQYDQLTMGAPHVVAKGADKVAFRIKEIAAQHKIMVMRNPPLARLLYDNAEVDEEIPYEYFKAVAEVIGYVYKLKGIKFSKPDKK